MVNGSCGSSSGSRVRENPGLQARGEVTNVSHLQTQEAVSEGGYLSKFSLPVRRRAGRGRTVPEARGSMSDRIIDLDLWAEGSAENLPEITVTGQGPRFEGNTSEFDRLLLILGGWLKP